MIYSEHLSGFLNFLRDTVNVYNIALSNEHEADNKTQDILHSLELTDHSYTERARLATALKRVRRDRRTAKDTRSIVSPIAEWYEQNQQTVKSLERLLGEVRKAEKRTDGRTYMDKTAIVEETIGKAE